MIFNKAIILADRKSYTMSVAIPKRFNKFF